MDEKNRNTGMETTDTEDSPQKQSRRRRTPSADPSDKSLKTKRRSRSHSSRSRSPSAGRNRRRRSRSRGFSPDRRWGGRFNRGGQRDFHNNRRRRSPSRSPYRGRNRNNRRSSSYDRYRNRRNSSRDRSTSQENRPSQPPQAPPAPNFQNEYAQPPHYQAGMPDYPVGQPGFPNAPPFGSYDYVSMMPPTAFPAYPPPPTQEYAWSTLVPPPPIISLAAVQPESAPVPIQTNPIGESDEEKQKREAAIAAEKRNQRDTIRKQRDDYIRRSSALKRELIALKEQREELISGNEPPSPTTHSFVKENDRLQSQIENKIGTIENVIEMLNGILSADKSDTESPKKPAKPATKPTVAASDDDSPERLKTKVIESLSKKRKDSDRIRDDAKKSKPLDIPLVEQINYTFFDPEQHWCKVCCAFPKTAKEYLLHLHSEEHKNNAKPPDIPWHDHLVKDDMPTYQNAPTKRTPIRGLQFFTPSTAWYCKLCCFWIGDLHCASSHLKSKTHAHEYDKYVAKNPLFETEWADERQKALDLCLVKEIEQSQKALAPPSPPVISVQKQNMTAAMLPMPPPPPSSYMTGMTNRDRGIFDGIPLQINQRAKEPPKEIVVNEEPEKKKDKGKKKKKEKKKRKKSKKKHRHSSSSSSSSSDESSTSPERKTSVEQNIDSSSSIRVAMRNAVNAVPPQRAHLKPKSDDEEVADNAGGWTVVQAEPKAPFVPKPPTISANGEAQNRRDDAMISQWTPLPVISEKEKQLFEQLKGKMKHREEKEKKKEKSPVPVQKSVPPPPNARSNVVRSPPQNQENSKGDDKRRNDNDRDFKEVKDKGRRDAYRRRSPSRSPSPRHDRRSRSPRRDRRRRSRSISPRRDRRYSRSPRRDRRRDRSKSRDRRNDTKSDKNNVSTSEKSNSGASKKTTLTITGKKLPFIGRMPVFKKQTDDESKKQDQPQQTINDKIEEEKLLQKKKQDELKFQVQQKQQLLQLQQKHAEAYNLAHPGQFANIYNTHGTIHHILPNTVQPEEYDLMPDPMHYATMMTAPPPPMPEPEVPHFVQETSEPVLPPGIDIEEAENMELEAAVPPPPPPTDNDNLPKDFQDALSIIFDKGAGKTGESTTTTDPAPIANAEGGHEIQHAVMQDETSSFAQMDVSPMDSHIDHEQNNINNAAMGATNMDLEDQSQYSLLYGDEQQHFMIQQPSAESQKINLATQGIPTPPIHVIDAAGNLTQIPGPVLEVGSDFVMLDADGNRIENYSIMPNASVVDGSAGNGVREHNHDIEQEHKRKQQELDDLAMLGIDADDLAAQCI